MVLWSLVGLALLVIAATIAMTLHTDLNGQNESKERARQGEIRIERDYALEKIGRALREAVEGTDAESRLLAALDAMKPTEREVRDVIHQSQGSGLRHSEVQSLLQPWLIAAVERETAWAIKQTQRIKS